MIAAAFPECAVFAGHVVAKSLVEQQAAARGRPKTRTLQHYRALMQEHECMAQWFAEVFKRPAKSDVELLTEYFVAHFTSHGLRPGRVASEEFKSKLKTLRNELSTARRVVRNCPVNTCFSGMQYAG